MIGVQPVSVIAHVLDSPPKSEWVSVSRHSSSPTGVISHVTVLGGSAAASGSYAMVNVITSRRGGSTSTISPVTAGPISPTYR